MGTFLALLMGQVASRAIDAGTAWTIIVTLAGVIAAMGLYIAKRETSRSKAIIAAKDVAALEVAAVREKCAAEVAKVKDDAAKEVKEMLVEQIRELRGHKELAGTLLDVIDRKRKGG